MKKTRILVLAMVLVLSLSGCGEKVGGTTETNQDTISQTAPMGAWEETEPTQPQSQGTEPIQEDTTEGTDALGVVEETLVLDNEFCTIKILGVENGPLGYALKTYLENKSEDTTYVFGVNEASINGVQTNPYFGSELPAGKKINTEINFPDDRSELKELGAYTDIMLVFMVYDSENWTDGPVVETPIHLYPFGKENAERYVREPQSTDKVLCDTEEIRVTYIGVDPDFEYGYAMNLFVENKTENTTIQVVEGSTSVNDFMMDHSSTVRGDVIPGCSAFITIFWDAELFEKNGIEEVTNIEMELECYDFNDWYADDFVDEFVSIQP